MAQRNSVGTKARTSLGRVSCFGRAGRKWEVEEHDVDQEQHVWKPVSLCDGKEPER
jgi:hypothetical protein